MDPKHFMEHYSCHVGKSLASIYGDGERERYDNPVKASYVELNVCID